MRKPFALLALAALSLVAAVGFGPAAGAQAATGTVTVIHGVPNTPVDVYVNNVKTLPNFQPKTVTDPLTLPAGPYTIDIRPAGAAADSAPIITGSTTLPAGANVTLIAYLDPADAGQLGVFVNDTSPTPAGEGRLVVRHTAAAPAVDVLASGVEVLKGLTNPKGATVELPASTVSASVALAGTTTPVIGPVDVPVVAGQETIVYAIGSARDKTLGAVVQTITVGQKAATTTTKPATAPKATVPVPKGVPSGDSGLAATGGSSFPATLGVVVAMLALAGVSISSRKLLVARRQR